MTARDVRFSPAETPVDLEWGATWPTRERFGELARTRRVIPVARRVLADELSALGVHRRLARPDAPSFILESAEHDGTWGRWSFVGSDSPGRTAPRASRRAANDGASSGQPVRSGRSMASRQAAIRATRAPPWATWCQSCSSTRCSA